MKISISYPPLKSEKGTPLLGQNRQFQWFNSPTYIYPMIPAYAASLLKSKGYEVFWDDGIAEGLDYEEWKKRIIQAKPGLIAVETKTPVIKRHWKIINELKEELSASKIVLMGDHVTALPEESMRNSQVDFVIQGGDFDFILLSIADKLSGKGEFEGGVWYRENGEIKNSGVYDLHQHSLEELPMINRELTKWRLYAYKNGNFKYTPGSYMMSGRDCWWGRCAFCVTDDAKVFTEKGSKPIIDIKVGDSVLTHLGNYKNVSSLLNRHYIGKILEIKGNCLLPFKITPEHRVLSLQAGESRKPCKPKYKESGKLEKGDFLAIPINRDVIKKDNLELVEILELDPTIIKTGKKIAQETESKILELNKIGKSERSIAKLLNIDRETVHRYIILEKEGVLIQKVNPVSKNGEKIKFEGGKNWIISKIKLNEDVFRLFGYYLAEGCVTKLKNRPNSLVMSLTFSKKEKSYIADVSQIIKTNFGIDVNIHKNNKNNTVQITTGNSLLSKVFKNLFGDDCYNKSVPDFILKASTKRQKELLKGLFRGDAHYRKRGNREEYIFSTASDSLASQTVLMLLRCGAIPSVRVSQLRKKMTKKQNVISLSSVDMAIVFKGKFNEDVSQKLIYKKGFIDGKYAYVPILKISENDYDEKVYNLSVSGDQSYTVNFAGVSNCSWTTFFPGKNFRTRSAQKALDEVGHLIDLGVKEIMEDSGSLPIGEWLTDFCNGMIERGYNKKVVMSCNMRINAIKKLETWKLMKKAGFRFILFGLESANQETLDKIDKGLRVEEIEPGLKMCKEAGLEPHITAMIGYPWESKEDAQRTVDLAKKLFKKGYVDTLQATILIPYPGTPLYKYCKENDLLRFDDYDRFDQREQVMKSKLTTEDVKELTQGLYRSFASPEFIFRKIISVRSIDDVKFLFRAGRKLVGHLTDFKK